MAWLFTEAPALVARTRGTAPALTGPLRDTADIYAIGLSTRGPGAPRDEVLAIAHAYLDWIAPARTGADDFEWAINEGLCHASAAPTKAPHDR